MSLYLSLLSKFDSILKSRFCYRVILSRAEKYMKKQEMRMAEVFLSEYYSYPPSANDCANLLLRFAVILESSGNIDKAVSVLQKAVNLSDDPCIKNVLGCFLVKSVELEEGRKYLEQACEVSKNSAFLRDLANCCILMNDYDDALVYAETACEIERNEENLILLMKISLAVHNTETIEKIIGELIEKNVVNIDFFITAGHYYRNIGRFQEAKDMYLRAVAFDSMDAQLAIADFYVYQKEFVSAFEILDSLEKRFPENSTVLSGMCQAACAAHDMQRAAEYSAKMITLFPDYHIALLRRIECCYYSGRFSVLKKLFEEFSADDFEIAEWKARFLIVCGYYRAARKLLAEFSEGPDSPCYRQALLGEGRRRIMLMRRHQNGVQIILKSGKDILYDSVIPVLEPEDAALLHNCFTVTTDPELKLSGKDILCICIEQFQTVYDTGFDERFFSEFELFAEKWPALFDENSDNPESSYDFNFLEYGPDSGYESYNTSVYDEISGLCRHGVDILAGVNPHNQDEIAGCVRALIDSARSAVTVIGENIKDFSFAELPEQYPCAILMKNLMEKIRNMPEKIRQRIITELFYTEFRKMPFFPADSIIASCAGFNETLQCDQCSRKRTCTAFMLNQRIKASESIRLTFHAFSHLVSKMRAAAPKVFLSAAKILEFENEFFEQIKAEKAREICLSFLYMNDVAPSDNIFRQVLLFPDQAPVHINKLAEHFSVTDSPIITAQYCVEEFFHKNTRGFCGVVAPVPDFNKMHYRLSAIFESSLLIPVLVSELGELNLHVSGQFVHALDSDLVEVMFKSDSLLQFLCGCHEAVPGIIAPAADGFFLQEYSKKWLDAHRIFLNGDINTADWHYSVFESSENIQDNTVIVDQLVSADCCISSEMPTVVIGKQGCIKKNTHLCADGHTDSEELFRTAVDEFHSGLKPVLCLPPEYLQLFRCELEKCRIVFFYTGFSAENFTRCFGQFPPSVNFVICTKDVLVGKTLEKLPFLKIMIRNTGNSDKKFFEPQIIAGNILTAEELEKSGVSSVNLNNLLIARQDSVKIAFPKHQVIIRGTPRLSEEKQLLQAYNFMLGYRASSFMCDTGLLEESFDCTAEDALYKLYESGVAEIAHEYPCEYVSADTEKIMNSLFYYYYTVLEAMADYARLVIKKQGVINQDTFRDSGFVFADALKIIQDFEKFEFLKIIEIYPESVYVELHMPVEHMISKMRENRNMINLILLALGEGKSVDYFKLRRALSQQGLRMNELHFRFIARLLKQWNIADIHLVHPIGKTGVVFH